MASSGLKTNYGCVPFIQRFYTGGPYAVSSDGSFLACSCEDSVKLVDASNGYVKSTLEGDTESVTALAMSPDDALLFSCSHSRQIAVWDIATSKRLRLWKGHEGPIMAACCDPSGGLLATAGSDRKLLVWDIDGGFCTHYFKGHKGTITSVTFHPDPEKLHVFSGSDDATIRIWDLQSKKCIAKMEKHFSMVTSLVIQGDTLFSSGRDRVVNLWDLHDYHCKKTVPTFEITESLAVLRSENPNFITVGERGIVRIWDSKSGSCLFEQRSSDTASKRGFKGVVLLPEGILCITDDHQFLFYSLHRQTLTLTLTLTRRLIGYNEGIVDVKFLTDDEEDRLIIASNLEHVQVYDVRTSSCVGVLQGHTDTVLCVDTCVTDTGRKLVVTGSKDHTVRLWDADAERCVGVGDGSSAVTAVAFFNKRFDFFVTGSRDTMLRAWSVDVIDGGGLRTKATVAAHEKDINSVAVAPNDGLVCTGSQDRTARVWTLPDLVSVVELKGHKRAVWSVEFSPVDRCVVTGSGDRTVRVWGLPGGACLKTFDGHTSAVYKALFVSGGAQVVSCGGDGLLKLWTVRTGECAATRDAHDEPVWAMAVGGRSETVVTGDGGGAVCLWLDRSADDRDDAFFKDAEEALRAQDLENAVADSDFARAAEIAFGLGRPHRLLELLSRMPAVDVGRAVRSVGPDGVRKVLEYAREWNSKPKFSFVAQRVLRAVFRSFSPSEILEVKGIGELVEGLLTYSQRHFTRADRLVRSGFLLDYALSQMSAVHDGDVIVRSSKKRKSEYAGGGGDHRRDIKRPDCHGEQLDD